MEQARECIGSEHQDVYIKALTAVAEKGVPFALGGAFAVWNYTGIWRHTHDIDIFTTPENVQPAADALTDAGFDDLGEQAPGDREWIYHAVKTDIIVDIIWRFANRLTMVTSDWIDRGSPGEFLGVDVKFIPMEELVWSKIFTMNKHRCDWPDIMRIFRANCASFNWQRLLDLLGDHWLLLAGVIDVFDWQFPADSSCIPLDIRQELIRRRIDYKPEPNAPAREKLLDPWIHTRPEDICYLEP